MRLLRFLASVAVIMVIVAIAVALPMFYLSAVRVQQPPAPLGFGGTAYGSKLDRQLREQLSEGLRNPSPQLREAFEGVGDVSFAPAAQWEVRPAESSNSPALPVRVSPTPITESADSGSTSGGARELSADPAGDLAASRTRYVADRSRRPAWVNEVPQYDLAVALITVSSGPCATLSSADESLDNEIMRAVANYAERTYGMPIGASKLGFEVNEIKDRCIREPLYIEHGELTGIGPMHEMFARLEFDADFRQELGERWRSLTVLGRLVQIGYIGGGIVLAVGLLRFVLGKPAATPATATSPRGAPDPLPSAPANG